MNFLILHGSRPSTLHRCRFGFDDIFVESYFLFSEALKLLPEIEVAEIAGKRADFSGLKSFGMTRF